MICPQCGSQQPDGAAFCDQCGAALGGLAPGQPPVPSPAAVPPQPSMAGPSVCPNCGAPVIPGEAFCNNCGAPLSAVAPGVGAQVPPSVPPPPVSVPPSPVPGAGAQVCPQCGAPVEPGSAFCDMCGAPLTAAAPPTPPVPPPPPPVYPPPPPPPPYLPTSLPDGGRRLRPADCPGDQRRSPLPAGEERDSPGAGGPRQQRLPRHRPDPPRRG